MHTTNVSVCTRLLCLQSVALTSRRQQKGRLHVCSKSLFFDPDDNRQPILRLSFDKLAYITHRQHRDTKTSPATDYMSLITRELCEIQSNTPYTVTKLDPGKVQAEYMVTLQYSDMAKVVPFISRLHDIAVNTPFKQKEEALARVIRQHEENIQFDSSSITDIREVRHAHTRAWQRGGTLGTATNIHHTAHVNLSTRCVYPSAEGAAAWWSRHPVQSGDAPRHHTRRADAHRPAPLLPVIQQRQQRGGQQVGHQ